MSPYPWHWIWQVVKIVEMTSNQARLSSTSITVKTLHFRGSWYHNNQNYVIYWTHGNDLCLSLCTKPVIRSFSLALGQSLQPTSEQTVLWGLSKNIYIPSWQQRDCQAWLRRACTNKSLLATHSIWNQFSQTMQAAHARVTESKLVERLKVWFIWSLNAKSLSLPEMFTRQSFKLTQDKVSLLRVNHTSETLSKPKNTHISKNYELKVSSDKTIGNISSKTDQSKHSWGEAKRNAVRRLVGCKLRALTCSMENTFTLFAILIWLLTSSSII